MKFVHTILKALPRVYAHVVLMLSSSLAIAQDSTAKRSNSIDSNRWYDQGWVWFVIIVIAIIVILALTRKSGKDGMGREHNRYRDRS